MQQTTLQTIRQEYSQAIAHLDMAFQLLVQAHKRGEISADLWAEATRSVNIKLVQLECETHRVEKDVAAPEQLDTAHQSKRPASESSGALNADNKDHPSIR
jgi:hypothetical protein